MFTFPTDTQRITSKFSKSRRNPITNKVTPHYGVDIAEAGYHEIYACGHGTVSRSYRSESYGECIMIVHSHNGQTWETVYAHMRAGSRRVKEGDKVKEGQTIGIMGSTGHSTAQHLHFELHKGRWNVEKSNAVDPLDYLLRSTSGNQSIYIIQKGDTLTKIAKKYNTTVNKLVQMNDIKNKNLIYAGQKIKL